MPILYSTACPEDDEIHISIRIDTPTDVKEVRIELDTDDSAFTSNYYLRG